MLDEQALSESTGGCGLPLVQERGLMDTGYIVERESGHEKGYRGGNGFNGMVIDLYILKWVRSEGDSLRMGMKELCDKMSGSHDAPVSSSSSRVGRYKYSFKKRYARSFCEAIRNILDRNLHYSELRR